MTALFESLLLMIICDVFSISILIYLHCSRVGKPVLNTHMRPQGWMWFQMLCTYHVLTFSSLIYRTTFELDKYPEEWKDLITVVVRKWLSQTTWYQACITHSPFSA